MTTSSKEKTSGKDRRAQADDAYLLRLARILTATTIAVALSLAAFWYWAGRGRDFSGSAEHWGQFGDYVGGFVGTIIGAATLIFLAQTLHTTRRQLSIAQDQLEASQRELELTRAEMQSANAAQRRQAFEATFFRLLEHFRESTTQIGWSNTVGINSFSAMRQHMSGLYGTIARTKPAREAAVATYDDMYLSFGQWLGPYFRNLYHLHRLLHFSGLPEAQRVHYASLVRAQLSKYELIVLYYNLLSDHSKGLRPYVNFYGVLKHLEFDHLLEESHRDKAFGAPSIAESAYLDYETRLALNVTPDGIELSQLESQTA